MKLRSTTRVVHLAVALAAAFALPAAAGDFFSQTTFGSNFFSASPSCPAKRLPTFEAIAPVPAIIDPFGQDLVPIFCQVQTRAGGEDVKGVRGKYTSQLIVRHNMTGQLESFDLGGGAFKSNKRGIAEFEFDIPTELFADGFESGDVSAWSYTRSDFTNKKKVDNASVQCGKSASRSN